MVGSVDTLAADKGFPLRNGNFKWGAGFWLAPNRQDWRDSRNAKNFASRVMPSGKFVAGRLFTYGTV